MWQCHSAGGLGLHWGPGCEERGLVANRTRDAGLHAFVGRARERATLVSALEGAERGAGGVVLLRGEAGIGKSRTAREIAEEARGRGFAVSVGHCVDGGAAPAYGPWIRALHGTVAGRELEARRTPSAAAPDGDRADLDLENEREQLFRGVEEALRVAAATRPQLLVLEDLHWADLDSLRLLQHLERSLDGCAWLALGTQRDEEPGDARRAPALGAVARSASTLALGPLDEEEVAALVERWSGGPPSSDLVRAAHARSGGNPLFLCELLALVIASAGRVSVAAMDSVGIPAVLQQLMERRLEGLGQDTSDLLLRGAVLGEPFQLSELASWTERSAEGVLAALAPAEQRRLVEPAGGFADRFRFTHALVRDALLARTARAERARLHREVAALLEEAGRDQTEAELARLAEHHRRGASGHSAERAVECAAAAAARAGRERAPDHAVQHLLLALDSLPGVAAPAEALSRRRCELLLALGEARSHTAERHEANEAYREAGQIARELDLPDSRALAAIGLVGRDEEPRGLSVESQREVDLALAGLDRADTPLRAGLLALAARIARGRGDADRCERLAREAFTIAERLGRPDTWASAAYALHYSIGGAEALDERLALSEQMVAAAASGSSRRTELRARQRRFTDLLQIGDTHAADEELARIEALARECDHPAFRWNALGLAAGCDIWRGNLESAERRCAEAFEQGRQAGLRNAGALFAVQMFHLREAQGRLGELRPVMQEMVEKNPQVPSLPLIVPLAAMQEGDELLTRTTFEPLAARSFEDVPLDTDWLPVMTAHARVAAYLRDPERCDLLLEKLRPYAHWCITLPDGQFWEGSVAHRLALLESVLGKVDEARGHFRDALACHRRAGALPVLAQTLHDFGRFEAEQGRGEAVARDLLQEALALQRRVGVELFIERTEAALATLGGAEPADEVDHRRPAGRLERTGPQWTLEFGGRRAVVAHRKGMCDIAVLLRAPGRETHVLELMRPPSGGNEQAPTREDAAPGTGPRALAGVDSAALGQYRERLSELRLEREEAIARNDLAAQQGADAEIEWLERELRSAFGAGPDGASEFSQKARKAVYNRIRTAISAVAEAHPALGHHLRHSIRTGIVCVYQPETVEEWLVDDGDA